MTRAATPGGRAEELFRPGGSFFLIAGPCVLEDDALNLSVAEALAHISRELDLPLIFKASFDKANRSRPESPRGPGLDDGLEQLARVRSETGLPVLTDIHEVAQVAAVAEAVDVLQIPAFLCRQTDLLTAAGATGRPVNIKKGQWMAPEEMAGAVEKVRDGRREAGSIAEGGGGQGRGVAVTERGTFHGYGDLVVDMRSFDRMRAATGAPTIFDGTHSVQRPGAGPGVSGGDPEFIPTLVRAAVAAGADGLFLEVHPNPREAPSDGTNMLQIGSLGPLLEEVLALRASLGGRLVTGAASSRGPSPAGAPRHERPAADPGGAGAIRPGDDPRRGRCPDRQWRLHRRHGERRTGRAEALRHHGRPGDQDAPVGGAPRGAGQRA